MAIVIGYLIHDTDYDFVNQAGETISNKAGTWSVLSCTSHHTVEGEKPMGEDVGPCPVCGQ